MKTRVPSFRSLVLCLTGLMLTDVAVARGPFRDVKSREVAVSTPGRPVRDSQYTIVKVPVPSQAVFSVAVEINERALITGVYDVVLPAGGIAEYTYLWDGRTFKTVAYPGATITSVPGLNASGTILYGNWGSETEQTAGYYDVQRGTFTAIDPNLGKPLNFLLRANDAGVALGYSCEGTFWVSENCISWLWDGRTFETLHVPNQSLVIPTYLNNRREVTGFIVDVPNFTSFLHFRGVNTWIYPPGVTPTECIARAITNTGVILGNGETDPTAFWQPFLYDGRSTKLLPEYAAVGQTTYFGLNERGDLAGGYFDPAIGTIYAIVAYRN